VGRNISNSVSATINGELLGGIDPRTVGDFPDATIVDYYGKTNAPFDKFQTEAIGGVWQQQKADTRDLLGAAVEIKTTFANFLDYWPEYSKVVGGNANNYAVLNSLPYRIGDTIGIGNETSCNATITSIASNNTLTISRPIINQLYIGNKELNINGLYLRPIPTNSIYILGSTSDTIYKYTMPAATDIRTATLTESFYIGDKESASTGVTLSSNGMLMYVTGTNSDNVHQYSLSTAYSPNTATYVSTFVTGSTNPHGIIFNASGSTFYVLGSFNKTINQYTMSTPWMVSTASYTANVSVSSLGFPSDLFLSPNGTNLYVLDRTSAKIYQYGLEESDNIASAILTANAYIGAYESAPTAMTMRYTGRQLYIAGTTSDTIYQMTVDTAWDITTISNTLTVPVNTPLYITNTQADTESYLQDVYKIDQLESLSEQVATFSLVSWLQYFKIVTPKRKYYKNTCQWVYKGDECQYPGPGGGAIPGTSLIAPATAIAANNMIMPTSTGDVCAKSLAACTLRNNSLHYGGFSGVGRTVPQM
jgi:phage-related protein